MMFETGRENKQCIIKNKLIDEMLLIESNAFELGKTHKAIYDKRLAIHKDRFYKLVLKLSSLLTLQSK